MKNNYECNNLFFDFDAMTVYYELGNTIWKIRCHNKRLEWQGINNNWTVFNDNWINHDQGKLNDAYKKYQMDEAIEEEVLSEEKR